ncbi:type IV pilin protein [Pseudoduganella sp. S-14]|jgi:type IV pilus assembly protein PilE|uniref:type IV pilin protein n=1 Tax=Pseudoduganella sp. S-14 TaxID=3404065 RepID=UPI003CED2563
MEQQQAGAPRQAGFTLIEMMVTVAIIAILAAVAIPAYGDYIKTGRLPQATNNLASMRAKLEQYFQDNRSYDGACVAGTIAALPQADDFVYSCPTLTPTTYVVKAEGQGKMAGFTFTIDQSNNKKTIALPSGWGSASEASPVTCWVRKKGGTC